jgi:YHS domain-containing protein
MEGALSLLLFAGVFYLMMRFGCGAHMVHGHGGHEGRQHGSSVAGSAVDLVCGMAVVADQGYTKMHHGRQHHFCSRACLDKFEAHPERYLTITEGVR